jgi:hypothetical protein
MFRRRNSCPGPIRNNYTPLADRHQTAMRQKMQGRAGQGGPIVSCFKKPHSKDFSKNIEYFL